jgi:RNA polymerase sigma-70 factor (ECF subfamily)
VIGEEFAGLLAAAQAGSEAAFSRLWREANPALLRYLRVIAPGGEEDIAAETWVQVVRGLPSFRGDEQGWRAWLFTTARRRAIDQARHRSRRPEVPLDDVTAAQLPSSADSADAAMESLGTAAAIALVSGLPRMQAEVILLRVVAGLDTESVARILRKKPGTVRVAAHRGLRKLAQLTADAGVTL